MGIFQIEGRDFAWLTGERDDPEDRCLHGHVEVRIGEAVVAYDCTVSAAALYLLKTLTEDHIIHQDNQLLPCCGFFLVADKALENVTIIGCDYGVDWSVVHDGDSVRLILEDGEKRDLGLLCPRSLLCVCFAWHPPVAPEGATAIGCSPPPFSGAWPPGAPPDSRRPWRR